MLPREYSQAELSPGPAQGRGEDFQRIPTEFSWLSPRVNTHPHPQSSEKGPHGRSPGGIQTSPKVLWRLRACFTILLLLHMDHRVLPLRRDLTKLTENPSTTLSLGSFFLLQLKSRKNVEQCLCRRINHTQRNLLGPMKEPVLSALAVCSSSFREAAQTCFPFGISQGSCSSC